jgi:membrane protease YdiL (CAAX protease family)
MHELNGSLKKYYPAFWPAVNLVILYIFIQTIIDFPLALYDYYNGTEWLYNPWIKVPVYWGTTFFILFLGYRYSNRTLKEVFPFRIFNILVIPGMLISLIGLQYFLTYINIRLEAVLPPPGWFIEIFQRLFDSELGIWGEILRIVIIAPLVEELLFRGVIMNGFIRNYSKTGAIIYSALLFALFHLNPWQFPATFLLGIILGFVRIRTKSVFACILGHATHNGVILWSLKNQEIFFDIPIVEQGVSENYLINGSLIIAGLIIIFLSTRKVVRDQ